MSPSRDEIISYSKKHKPAYVEKYRLQKLGLFGSFARNDASSSSDIDILVEFNNNPDILGSEIELSREFAGVFHRQVDICREKCLKADVKNEILKDVLYV